MDKVEQKDLERRKALANKMQAIRDQLQLAQGMLEAFSEALQEQIECWRYKYQLQEGDRIEPDGTITRKLEAAPADQAS